MLTIVTGGPAALHRLERLKAACESLGGRSLFWFADRAAVDTPNILGDPVWQVAGSPGWRPLPLSIV